MVDEEFDAVAAAAENFCCPVQSADILQQQISYVRGARRPGYSGIPGRQAGK